MPQKQYIDKLLEKEEDLIYFNEFLNSAEVLDLKSKLMNSFMDNESHLKMKDGIFFPYPYSAVHQSVPHAEENYLKFSSDFNQNHQELIHLIIHKLEESIHDEIIPLKHYSGQQMASLNTRILYAKKNGIDIHCENAFTHQLEVDFLEWLKSKVDLENAISFLLVLQKPESGGDLILFNQVWDQISMQLGHTSIEERHDLGGSIFKNRGVKEVSYRRISIEPGDAVCFRAAQIWHAIDQVDGTKDRISIGCFIGKGKDGKKYFWA